MTFRVRRVVTGETDGGVSVFTRLDEVQPVVNRASDMYAVWGLDAVPALPTEPTDEYVHDRLFPLPGGVRVAVFEFRGEGSGDAHGDGDDAAAEAAISAHLAHEAPGLHSVDRATRMHATNSVDFGFVISGEIALELRDGGRVVLGQGDVVVQNGACHAWRRTSDEPCLVGFVLIGTTRRED